MVTVPAAIISARTLAFSLGLVFLAVFATAYVRGTILSAWPRLSSSRTLVAAFLAYATASALWAQMPLLTLEKTLIASAIALGSGFLIRVFYAEARRNVLHIAEGLWIGLLVGVVYFLIEQMTGQAIKLWLYNALQLQPGALRPPDYFQWAGDRLIAISPQDLTRNTAPVMAFLWPAILAAGATATTVTGRAIPWLLFVLSLLVVMQSMHETSKLAVVISAAAFLATRYALHLSVRAARVVWIAACLAVVPLSIGAHRLGLHQAPWLQPSAQHRIEIWNHTATETLKSPFFGIGANMMYALHPGMVRSNLPDARNPRSTQVPHAHNVYLQTWLELGGVGAALLCLIGLALIERIRKLGPQLAPFAMATFASCATLAATSYGMWQIWFMAMFGLTGVIFAIAARAAVRREYLPSPFKRSNAQA